jgi:hypothetical protein
MRQFLIAFDQLINTVIYIKGDGFGFADETLSARAWRLRTLSSFPYRFINALFFWQEDHCRQAYEAEHNNSQLPKEYRNAAY